MTRREFIHVIGGAIAADQGGASAEPLTPLRRVGLLSPAATRNALDQTFEDALRELGWVKDRNIIIETRYTAGQNETVAAVISELVGLHLELIVVWTQALTRALMRAAPRTPVVFVAVLDAIGEKLVASLARPGGYATGISGSPSSQIVAKRLQLLNDVVPSLMRVCVLRSTEQSYGGEAKDALLVSASKLNLTLDEVVIETPGEIEHGLRRAKEGGAKGVYAWQGGFTYSFAPQISKNALALGLPSIFAFKESVIAGGLLGYGPNFTALARRASIYVDKILRGTPPGDIPVEQPTKFELIINLKTAKALGLDIPATLVAGADEVIE
jgi:putative ABC transport system substrate-binding protein